MERASLPVASLQPAAASVRAHIIRQRRISPQAGRALELLGHAIDYLTDEFVHEGATPSANHPQLLAIQMLMALNRKVYFECPELPGLCYRCRAILRLLLA
ncbi:MAG: hypothetical protein P4K86_05890 [Terracidiphilus sp.]|nr:hypothetical protein [Terracidiphilus sp.]